MIKSKIRYELGQINMGIATAMATIFIFVDFAVWSAVGSPVYILRFISGRIPVLPLWAFGLLDFVSFALLGFALGTALGSRCVANEVAKYRGAFYFVIGVTLNCLHHVLFFSNAAFFIALLVALLMCFFLTVGVVNFSCVSGLSMLASCLGVLWSFYLMIINLLCFFLL